VKDTLTITVRPGKPVDLVPDQTTCFGTTLILDAGEDYISYEWQDGSTDRFFHVLETGNYNVWVTNDHGCKYYDNVHITVENKPTVNLGSDTLICDEFFPLSLKYEPNVNYSWSTGATTPEIVPTNSGVYFVTVKNSCGETSDTIRIYSSDDIFIPNVVTINNDGLNDKFIIKGNALDMELKVYNRWGDEIFQVKKYNDNWPFENEDISSGTYYYKLTYPGCKTFNGWVQVIKK
jgi:gliding motility-associated-like protein